MEYEKILKSLSDRTRFRIFYTLLKAGKELCICEIMDSLQKAHYNISRHMRELKLAGIVKERREGKFMFYSLAATENKFINGLAGIISSIPEKEFCEDMAGLKKRISLREKGKCVIGILKNCCKGG